MMTEDNRVAVKGVNIIKMSNKRAAVFGVLFVEVLFKIFLQAVTVRPKEKNTVKRVRKSFRKPQR